MIVLRPLTADDLPEIHRLEAETYLPILHESDEAFLRLIALFPEGALGLFEGYELCAYAFALPWRSGVVLELQSPPGELPPGADVFYIHDVAVGERYRGRGLARRLVEELLRIAVGRGFRRSELVSVQDSAPFWRQFGFELVAEFEYAGAPAAKMARQLGRV
jgi:ribosomal protein S18 acetylase RimI-like enzyme